MTSTVRVKYYNDARTQWMHLASCTTSYSFNLQITKSDTRPHTKWAVSLVTVDGHFNLKNKSLCRYVWVNILTLSPLKVMHTVKIHLGMWYFLNPKIPYPLHLYTYQKKQKIIHCMQKKRKMILTLKVLNFWKFTSYCSLKPLWSGMGEVVLARTSPTLHPPSPPTVYQLSRLAF